MQFFEIIKVINLVLGIYRGVKDGGVDNESVILSVLSEFIPELKSPEAQAIMPELKSLIAGFRELLSGLRK
jgi:hypothetical protein